MTSKLQLDVCYFGLGWRHLVNAYGVKTDIICVCGRLNCVIPLLSGHI